MVAVTTEAAQEILFDPKVTFKPNASSRLLEITFERQELFSALNQSEANVRTFQCSLRKNGSVHGWFEQDGDNQIFPFTVLIAHDPCEPIEDLSIRCEIQLATLENEHVNAKSKVFSYEGSSDLFNSPCDMSVYYALTIGNINILRIRKAEGFGRCVMLFKSYITSCIITSRWRDPQCLLSDSNHCSGLLLHEEGQI